MKNLNNLQIVKDQTQGVLSICQIFCQFYPGVNYKSVAFKKSMYMIAYGDQYFVKPNTMAFNSQDTEKCIEASMNPFSKEVSESHYYNICSGKVTTPN